MNTLDMFFFMRDAALRFTAIAVSGQDRHSPATLCQLLSQLIHVRGTRHIVRKEKMVQEQNRWFVWVVYGRHGVCKMRQRSLSLSFWERAGVRVFVRRLP